MEPQVRKEKLSIYLVKDIHIENEKLIKHDDLKEPIHFDVNGISGVLYAKMDHPKLPSWTNFFLSTITVPDGFFGRSQAVSAVAVIHRNTRTFILSFGHGHHLINLDHVERDFGLRVTLNSVDPDKLRSVDKASYADNPLNSRTQSSSEVDIFQLQMDSEMELLHAVTGNSKISTFGQNVTGRDALTIVVGIDLSGLAPILDEALIKYNEKLPIQFEWVDNIRRVKDGLIIETLDSYLSEKLEIADDQIWLGEPEIVDWEDQVGYSFDLRSRTPRHAVLSYSKLVEYFQGQCRPVSVQALKSQLIHANDAQYRARQSWPAYRCLYAELKIGTEQYLLRNGHWYQAEASFVESINDFLERHVRPYPHDLPTYGAGREDEYNLATSQGDTSFTLMDKNNTKLGGRYDKIEFCDLIKNNTDLIHVKYYRSSSTLSHLFAQGLVASEAFIKDEEFRKKINEKLPNCIRLDDPLPRPDASSYNVVYAIATNKSLPSELPFFSKVILRNSLRTLTAIGFNVFLAKISVDPTLYKKLTYKPKP